jgi:hypothetical protein
MFYNIDSQVALDHTGKGKLFIENVEAGAQAIKISNRSVKNPPDQLCCEVAISAGV